METQMAEIPNFLEYMMEAAEACQAGFHFEEGGCFAMAKALYEAFAEQGVIAETGVVRAWGHALVRVGDQFFDHSGVVLQSVAAFEPVPPEGLCALAEEYGWSEGEFDADYEWAKDIIQVAIEMVPTLQFKR
jgi:hypothetical protein